MQPSSQEIISNIDLKTEDSFIDNDDFDLFKKPEKQKNDGQKMKMMVW